jgi:hypothetical protein
VVRTSSYNGDMDHGVPEPDTVTAPVGAGHARSDDLLVVLGQVLRAISDALASIDDKRRGSLAARRLISTVLFFIRALLRALRAEQYTSRPSSRGAATFDRALVAPPCRWAAP